jgi:hypothetical protein
MLNTHAGRLIAISREAQEQSEIAIRRSLRLLRQSIYPNNDLTLVNRAVRPSVEQLSADRSGDDRGNQGHHRSRWIGW